ncbi:GNAT family N-acetyltransferase [Erythrobacter sp. SN021]|uniref:GNAT family N-acetyltransferase n=1 Tax=Erythrobacter sp. SN021 TaxID=2912574 RepID=UPI001F2F60C5|nr:GNAT family N-acetyltransferase [Erythrobacter sp. SN021]MCF8881539.1 GNAT family N-acetyltransferase [Erythrobacter sp. SN021]
MTNALIIRLAMIDHASALASLGRATFKQAFAHLFQDHGETLETYLEQTFTLNKIAKSLQKPNNKYWLALIDEKPIGYAKLKLGSSHPLCRGRRIGQLQKIYVDSAEIGGGVGRALVKIIEDEARRQLCDRLWLSVHDGNAQARGFYERIGWRDIGQDTFAIGELQLSYRIMVRDLES